MWRKLGMPKATRDNVLKELTDTFDFKESIANQIIDKHKDLPYKGEDQADYVESLADYLAADCLVDLEYGNNDIPREHLQGNN